MVTSAPTHLYTQEARDNLRNIWEWEDKNNARDFLQWQLIMENDKNGLRFSVAGKTINLGKVAPEHEPLFRELFTTLIVEKWVCEARSYLLSQCKAEVTKRWVLPLHAGPDIKSNDSMLKINKDILRYEVLQDIFWKKANIRNISDNIVDFSNGIPKWFIPLQVIEGKWKSIK